MQTAVKSGETTLIETNEFEWQKNISSGEYLDIESIEIGTNNTISLRKKIPFYKYIINYLLLTHFEELGFKEEEIGEIAGEIFDSIEKNEKNANFELLVNLVVDLFKERGLAPEASKSEVYGSLDYNPEDRKIWKKTQIRKDLKANAISRDKLFVYAFGIGMDISELEVFIMKVLEESGLNIWDQKEALIYIALKHFPSNPVEFYIRAMHMYDTDDNVINIEAKETNLNTTILQNSLDEYLVNYREEQLPTDEIIANINAYHKDLVSENTTRTIYNEFTNTFREVEEKLEYEIEAFSGVKYGNANDPTGSADYFSRGNVKIFYKTDTDILITTDTPFIFKSEKSDEVKTYYPEEDFTLEATDKTATKEITLQSGFYKFKEEVPVLGVGEEYADFTYQNDIPAIEKIEHESIYISEKKLSSLLTFLYNEDALILREDSTLPADQIEALDDLLKETRIKHENLNAIMEKGNISQITRPRLITLYFLTFVLDNEDIWFDKLQTPAKRKRNYLIFMDYNLRNSRLYEYNILNPYEETLLKLVVYDEPIEAFRDLWAKYLVNIGES